MHAESRVAPDGVGADGAHSSGRVPLNLLEEHIASRKDLGDYLNVTTALHRARIARTDEFIREICARLERASRGARNHEG